MRNSPIFAADAQTDPGSKTESREEKRHGGKLFGEKIDGDANIISFARTAVVFSRAQARTAKIEAQDGKTKRVERFRRLVDHLVVQRAAKKRMRMTDHGRHR